MKFYSFFPMLTLVFVPLAAQSPGPAAATAGSRSAPGGPASTPGPAQGHSGSDWTFAAGLMGARGPRYLGSDETHNAAAPFLDLNYKDIAGFQVSRTLDRTMGLYYRPFQAGPWSLGILAMGEAQVRKEKDAKALEGMGDRKRGLFYGLDLAFRTDPIEASLEILQGSSKAGLVAGLNLKHAFHFNEQLGLELGLTGIWGDKNYHAWEFGITPAQAARRADLIQAGNPDLRSADATPFTPKAGPREYRAEAMLQWRVTEKFMSVAMLQHGRLLQDAANSPLTRSRNQTSFVLGFAYQFSGGGPGR